ncbi:eukaryotic translation initiation factor 4E [Gigaspora margarita]|uniref:Eukaryotic translation initiation factor 4E n=2 Tax=Gigaspora TaxID=4873 RepID=A0A8H3X0N1_GIGMA|nr:eukaryotic translation initiation factor 4E [Gigaspora margarita]
MESVWKSRSNRLTVNTDHSNTTTTTTTATATTPTTSSSTKLIQLQRTSSPNGVTSASAVLLTPTTPLGMGAGLVNSSSGSGYLTKHRLSVTGGGGGEDKDNKEKENGNSSNGLVIGLTRQQFTPSPTSEIHPLHFTWVFWFMHRSPGSKILNYESSMKKIAAFSSIEDFWAVYSHLRRPHELPNISDYHLFKQGVRPVWEDDTNINGGKWIVRLKKGLASRYWESLVMAVIGDQFDVGTEICGAVLSIRSSEDILSLWNQSAHEGRINLKIRDTMKRVLNLPSETIMEYKTHNDALKDNSSFRNTDVFR